MNSILARNGKLFSNIENALTASPTIITTTGLVALLLNKNVKLPLAFLVGEYLFGFSFNRLLKKILKKKSPNRVDWKRPVDHPSTGCGSFPNPNYDGEKNESFGMPSGHAQISAFAAAYLSVLIFHEMQKNHSATLRFSKWKPFVVIGILWIVQYMIGRMRVKIKCHTKKQVLMGTIIGGIMGVIYGQFTIRVIK